MPNITPEYLAGLIDGEGCLSPTSRSGRHYPRLKVQMTSWASKRLLVACARQWGGTLYEAEREGKQGVITWSVSKTSELYPLLKAVERHMVVKKRQVMEAKKGCENLLNKKGRRWTRQLLQEMKRMSENIKRLNNNGTAKSAD